MLICYTFIQMKFSMSQDNSAQSVSLGSNIPPVFYHLFTTG